MKDTNSHPWLKLPPKLRAKLDCLSRDGVALFTMLEFFSADTGGTAVIPRRRLDAATARRYRPKELAAAIRELVDEGLLVEHADDVELTVWEQPPVETWQDDMLRFRFQRNGRLKYMNELKAAVRQRDRSLCRYCGVRVTWSNDHRSGTSGTFDHVDPDGENTLDNLVVACRRCNGRKKDRTPEQAKMPLLKPGTAAAAPAVADAPLGTESPALAPVPEQRAGSDPGGGPVDEPVTTRSYPGHNLGPPGARTRDQTYPFLTGSQPGQSLPSTGGSPHASPNGES